MERHSKRNTATKGPPLCNICKKRRAPRGQRTCSTCLIDAKKGTHAGTNEQK